MYLVLVVGIVLWLIYGTMKGDATLIVANVMTLTLACGILAAKISYN